MSRIRLWLLGFGLAIVVIGGVLVGIYSHVQNQRLEFGPPSPPKPVGWTYTRAQLQQAMGEAEKRKGNILYRHVARLLYGMQSVLDFKAVCSDCVAVRIEGMTVSENSALMDHLVERFYDATGKELIVNPDPLGPDKRYSVRVFQALNTLVGVKD